MKISDKSAELLRTEPVKASRLPATDSNIREIVQPILPINRADRVQISDAGRAMISRAGAGEPSAPAAGPERTAEIRKRVLQGAYNSMGMVDQVARRILSSGDL